MYLLLQPALFVRRFNKSSRLISRSKAKIFPVLRTNADKCDVLFPGAAHASMMWDPFAGLQTWAGKQEALSYAIQWIYIPIINNSMIAFSIKIYTCKMSSPDMYMGWSWRSELGGRTSRSFKWMSRRTVILLQKCDEFQSVMLLPSFLSHLYLNEERSSRASSSVYPSLMNACIALSTVVLCSLTRT